MKSRSFSANSARTFFLFVALLLVVPALAAGPATTAPLIPTIEGKSWCIAVRPDLGVYGRGGQLVDFTVFQADDGTWQIWGCIRGFKVNPGSRLLHRWESAHLTDTNWTPKGIVLLPDTNLGENMVQSPYCFKEDGLFNMFYSDFNTPQICRQTSKDGKHFTRLLTNGKVGLWAMSQTDQFHGRDPMVIKIGGSYHSRTMGNSMRLGMPEILVPIRWLFWVGRKPRSQPRRIESDT